MERRWRVRERDPGAERRLARELGVSTALAALLRNRGLVRPEAARAWLQPDLRELEQPLELPDMEAAATRLARAVRDREPVLIYGDYDVDGMVGTVILFNLLRLAGARVATHIPNRLHDDYSFGGDGVERLLRREPRPALVVTVDHGISATEAVEHLARAGVDVLVTDHHEPPDVLPEGAVALVNPKLPGCTAANTSPCGAAVAFKLAWATAQKLSGLQRVTQEFRDYLVEAMSMVALATVADVVPLTGENRILCHHGLRGMTASSNPGIRALIRNARLSGRSISAVHCGFRLGPRLNAAGRMGMAQVALELLTTSDPARARALADRLEEANKERRRLERELLEHILGLPEMDGFDSGHGICLGASGWHHGVIGIVASRLVERFHVPVLIAGFNGSRGRASARSIPTVHLRDLLADLAEHLLGFGGHAGAAGCSLEHASFPRFREAFHERTAELLKAQPYVPSLDIDLELPFKRIRRPLLEELERLAPHGEGNPEPCFLTRGVQVAGRPRIMGRDQRHLAFFARHDGQVLRAVFFGGASWADRLRAPETSVNICYRIKENDFNGSGALELHVLDLRPAG